ncbi:hypothetical protein KGM_208825 [Danaus plexippus plexippus]|uniref:C2 domain-containing protein n=1 Tax=Danaus plexippus plexippus TaxID=278856 RepID=A0A212EYN7_DANPL|nr:hypothetical protein KGM_208825 [Danaus plexippus plexippus]
MSKKSTTEEAPRDKDGGAMRKLFNCEPNPLTVIVKMLKWTVYGRKNQEVQVANDDDDPYRPRAYDEKTRRSLDAQTVKKSKKPTRYQRRSLGAAARKNNCRNIDKENFNCVGNTPNHFRDGFVKKIENLALKDVSNITPTNSSIYKSERRLKQDRSLIASPKLSHSVSEPSLKELSDRLSSSSESNRSSLVISKQSHIKKPVSTTVTASEGLVEIEYDKDLIINCIEKPLFVDKTKLEKSTLPIFGHRLFTDNPVYFNKHENGAPNIRPLKRTRKKSNEFESSFKSPTIDKRDVHALVRDGCSPVSITPLSLKLAALRFSTMSTHTRSQRVSGNNDITEYFPKQNPFTVPFRDEESATEMENKFILGKDSIASISESTVSTTQMGDITLEKMIEDIIKSTKIVKSKRRILNKISDTDDIKEEEIPSLEAVKDLFVKPKPEIKSNVIKEARYVNLSRESSMSPQTTPIKKRTPLHKANEKLLKNVPIGGFILDDGDGYNEREVRTPDKHSTTENDINSIDDIAVLTRSKSMTSRTPGKSILQQTESASTPDLYSVLNECRNNRLRRQKCIRRKKSTVSNESLWKQKPMEHKSSLVLALEMGIPSPALDLQNTSLCQPLENPESEFACVNNSLRSNVSHSSLKVCEPIQNKKSRELFGLTLENGIPSPITPVTNLKRTSNVLSEERVHKTSKLGEELLPSNAITPVIEHKTSRRCLTYSPEESSINSNEEKRRSVVSNRLERSADRFQALKGTIDLEVITKNDTIDVHVIRCRDLQRASGKVDDINAYAKVVISGVTEDQSLPSQRSIFQRTSVLYGKREPEFQRHLKLPLPSTIYDHQMLHISVWHRDKKYR